MRREGLTPARALWILVGVVALSVPAAALAILWAATQLVALAGR